MLVIPTIDDQRRKVTLEVSHMDNGCISISISGEYVNADAILNGEEREELVKWLS